MLFLTMVWNIPGKEKVAKWTSPPPPDQHPPPQTPYYSFRGVVSRQRVKNLSRLG